jgi:hypothetical protein
MGALGANLGISVYCKLKIARILKGLPSAPVFAFGKKFLKSYGDARWHRAYAAANGIISDFYVPEDLFHVNIEARLNPAGRTAFYLDKNTMDKLSLPCNRPRTLGRMIRGVFFGEDYHKTDPGRLRALPSVVVKPSLATGGGRNITFMTGIEAAAFAEQCMARGAPDEYIFQEPIRQTPRLAGFGPDSVNTIRIMTMMDDGKVRALSSVLRMGRAGSKVDNQAAGGISCGIKDGRLIAAAYDKNFLSYRAHPDTETSFENFEVPGYEGAQRTCLDLHRLMPEIGLVSWDIAVDEKEQPVLIEMNMRDQEINFHQLAHGPLFGDRLPNLLVKTKPVVFLGVPLG